VSLIGRLWHGWTAAGEDADAYERFLRDDLFPQLEAIAGYRGGYVMRRPAGGEVEFATLTLWESIDAVREFAGDEYDTPVIEPEAARRLAHYDDRVSHFDAVVAPA
jgi:hypothetical protein